MKILYLTIAAGVIVSVTIGLIITLMPNAIFCSTNASQLGAQRRVDNLKIGLQENYLRNEPIQMYVEWSGVWKGGYIPDVSVKDSNGSEVWHQQNLVHTETVELECGNFGFMPENPTGFLSLNKSDTYTVTATVGDKTVQRQFHVLSYFIPDNHTHSQTVTLTGDNAWKICSALRIPCSSNPSFQATLIGDYYLTVITINGIDYNVILNRTSTCVRLATSETGQCIS